MNSKKPRVRRPSKRFPFDPEYDFSYRPATYWPDSTAGENATTNPEESDEFLPDAPTGEVEIVHIELETMLTDAWYVRARPGKGGQIHYRVVDAKMVGWEPLAFSISQETSDEPLTLGELIELIDTSNAEEDLWRSGLVDSHRDYHYAESYPDANLAECAFHATPTSNFYPMLKAYYTARAEAWITKTEAELKAEQADWDDEL